MSPFAKFLRFTRAITIWKDGDGISFYWNWWHPLSWIMVPLFLVANVFVSGVPETIKYSHDIGVGVSAYWRGKKREYL